MKSKVVLTAGGTGGHLFPALSLADQLKEQGYTPLLLVSPKEVQKKWIKNISHEYSVLPLFPPSNWKDFSFHFYPALRKASLFFQKHQPLALLSFGSYVSLAPSLAAFWQAIPLICFEQNVIPGRVNRLLNPLAHIMVLQWMESKKYFFYPSNLKVWGSPSRFLKTYPKEKARTILGLHPSKMTLLVMGGSQGAKRFNEKLIQALPLLKGLEKEIQWIHLTGREDEKRVREAYEKSGFTFYVEGFSDNMGLLYSAAHVLFARSGGTTIWEASKFSLPMVLVPYPYAASQHQMANSKAVEERGGALILEQKDLNPKRILEFTQLLLNPNRRKKMALSSGLISQQNEMEKIFSLLAKFQERRRIMRRNQNYAA